MPGRSPCDGPCASHQIQRVCATLSQVNLPSQGPWQPKAKQGDEIAVDNPNLQRHCSDHRDLLEQTNAEFLRKVGASFLVLSVSRAGQVALRWYPSLMGLFGFLFLVFVLKTPHLTSLLHLSVISSVPRTYTSDPGRLEPYKTRAQRLQSSGSARLLFLEPALLLL